MKRGADRFFILLVAVSAATVLGYWFWTKGHHVPSPPPPPPPPGQVTFPQDPVRSSKDLLQALHQGLEARDMLKLLERPVESSMVDAGGRPARGYRETYRLPRRWAASDLAKEVLGVQGPEGARFKEGVWKDDPEGRAFEAVYGFPGGWNPVTVVFLDLKLPRLALVVDDAGYKEGRDLMVMWDLKVPATVAVIPGLEYSTAIAEQAPSHGWEVICHMPMEGHEYTAPEAYKWFLRPNTTPEELVRNLSGALSEIPNCRGMNNHMGSHATEEKDLMLQTAHFLRERGLIFLDSRTSEKSVAGTVMRQAGVPTADRNVFLDNSAKEAAIRKQLRLAIAKAKKRGAAVAIGHFRKSSLQAFSKYLPEVKAAGVKLVYLSELVN